MKELFVLQPKLPELGLEPLLAADLEPQLTIFEKSAAGGALLVSPILNHLDYLSSANKITEGLASTDSVYLRQAGNYLRSWIDESQQRLEVACDATKTGATVVNSSLGSELAELRDPETRAYWRDHEAKKATDSEYITVIQRLAALGMVAHALKRDGYAPVIFNTTGEFLLKDCFASYRAKEASVPNDIVMSAGAKMRVATGPNGSGKTYFEKSAATAVTLAMTTGYAPASSAAMPYFDRVVYMDRVTKKLDPELSSFAQELELWKKLYKGAEGKRAFIVADELFSTTSPAYQGALTYATVARLIESPHYAVLATHNHEVVDRVGSDAHPFHFGFTINESDGTIGYEFKAAHGHAQSYALEVAETLGLPREIIRAARIARDCTHKN